MRACSLDGNQWQPFWISTYLTNAWANYYQEESTEISTSDNETNLQKFVAVECIKCCTTLFWQQGLAPYTSKVIGNLSGSSFRGWFEKRKSWDMRKYDWRSLFHSIRKMISLNSQRPMAANFILFRLWENIWNIAAFNINFRNIWLLFFQKCPPKCHHEQPWMARSI